MYDLESITFRRPTLEDGMDVYRLVESCSPLDTNSSYCNLLQCSHFSDTSIAAEIDGKLAGFVSGYILPARPNTLFIWQVAVAEQARGLGLASRMLTNLLARTQNPSSTSTPISTSVEYLETTITQDNKPSWALFEGLAKKQSVALNTSDWMDKEAHFSGQHDSETLVRLGPFPLTSK